MKTYGDSVGQPEHLPGAEVSSEEGLGGGGVDVIAVTAAAAHRAGLEQALACGEEGPFAVHVD